MFANVNKTKLSGAASRKRKAEKEKLLNEESKKMKINKYLKIAESECNVTTPNTVESTIERNNQIGDINPDKDYNIPSENDTELENPKLINDKNKKININQYSATGTSGSTASTSKVFYEPNSGNNDRIEDIKFDKDVNSQLEIESVRLENPNFDVQDPMLWPTKKDSRFINFIISQGIEKVELNDYPKDDYGRHFSSKHYIRKLANNEIIQRRWLQYSKSADKIFCICCLCFDNVSKTSLASSGYNNWRHISETLQSHESSATHMKYYQQWIELELRLKKGRTIDAVEQLLIEKESERWKNVLIRLMNIILYLAEHNSGFRGSSDKLYTDNNGKYLGLIQLLAKFDPIMQDHTSRILKGELVDHYCGKNILNELIILMANEVNNKIVTEIQNSKYFSIIADCTPDISHVEQLSVTIRYLNFESNDVEVCERFLGFVPVEDSTGKGLTAVILDVLHRNKLDIKNCRGQGYDNGANMKGKKIGVQKQILNQNPLAFFMPCGCHSLNLVICDAAKCSVKTINFFGVLGRLFTLFSGSTKRWDILNQHMEKFTLKKLSDTRWEARINSVKAIRYQIGDVYDALVSLAEKEKTHDITISHEATTLSHQLQDFGFLVSLVVWYDILYQINIVSKVMQNKTIDLSKTTSMMELCKQFLIDYKKTGFEIAIKSAKDLATELKIEPEFKNTKRNRYVKRQFDYESRDEIIETPEKKFRVEFFNAVLDTAIASIDERFSQLVEHSELWGFLYDLKKLPKKEDLMKNCADLQVALMVDNNADIDGRILCDELVSIKSFFQDKSDATPVDVLNFIKQSNIEDLYPNIWIALRILLTIPVTVASGERSFSKLKLIKTYLRSTLSQENLTALATLSIENRLAKTIDFADVIKIFSASKARKVKF